MNFSSWKCPSACVAAACLILGSCSAFNREGPDVTCADLGHGALNACREGIITSCNNGSETYRVCKKESVCEATWQIPGGYRCEESEAMPYLSSTSSAPPSEQPEPPMESTYPACGWDYREAACASCVLQTCCVTAQACADEAPCVSCATRTGAQAPCLAELIPAYEALLECQRNCGCE